MPIVKYKSQKIEVASGTNLKRALAKANLSPYNGSSKYLNCKGLGTCGTCAVSIKGDTTPKTAVEKWRLNFPPHQEENGLRLACQVKVINDLVVEKHAGFWGHQV
ncbi:MAG: 2Fe-2S iron-sulfur cluster binding domain-containing protein [Bacteroidota bacterium]